MPAADELQGRHECGLLIALRTERGWKWTESYSNGEIMCILLSMKICQAAFQALLEQEFSAQAAAVKIQTEVSNSASCLFQESHRKSKTLASFPLLRTESRRKCFSDVMQEF